MYIKFVVQHSLGVEIWVTLLCVTQQHTLLTTHGIVLYWGYQLLRVLITVSTMRRGCYLVGVYVTVGIMCMGLRLALKISPS